MRAEIKSSVVALPLFLVLSWPISTSALKLRMRSNPLGLDYDPAPSPADGPPLSAGALRDPAYLPAQVGGIVGAYVLIVSVIGIALLLVGRRQRTIAEQRKADIELQQTVQIKSAREYITPISPGQRNFSYPSPEKNDPSPYVFPSITRSPISPVGSDPNVDQRIVEADRDLLARNLEDLYAHVMEQDEAKANGIVLTTPVSPPRQPQPVPTAAPQRSMNKSSSRTLNLDMHNEKHHSRASSIVSSLLSPKKKSGVRGLRISSPIPTPLKATFPADYASDEEPLSPRKFTAPPPPPVPSSIYPYQHSRNESSATTTTDPSPVSPQRSVSDHLGPYKGPQHHHQTSQTSFQSQTSVDQTRRGTPLSANPTGSPRPSLPISPRQNTQRPIPQTLKIPTSNNPAGVPSATTATTSNLSATRALPFRAFDPPPGLTSPSFSHTTKTTVLERTTPLSPGLRTPWTAGALPLSPYQPYTPVIPLTPTLVTREERKRKEKEAKKVPVMEMIKSEDEMWDGGY